MFINVAQVVTSGEHCRHSWHIEAPYLGTLSSPPRPDEARLEDRGCRAETGNIWDSDTLADEGTRWIWWEPAQPLHMLMRPKHCQNKKLMQIIHARLWFARCISTFPVSVWPWPWLLLAPDCPRTRHWSPVRWRKTVLFILLHNTSYYRTEVLQLAAI